MSFDSISIFLVIVTEKKNILLRYLHQQWDKKVRILQIAFKITLLRSNFRNVILLPSIFIFYVKQKKAPVKKREHTNENAADSARSKRPRMERDPN